MVFRCFVWLPAEGCFIGYPFALCPQDLFDDVPPTTLSAAERRDVAGYLFNFGGGIGGTTNYNGKELTGILEAWAAGDLETARERQNFSQEVINVICRYRGNIVGGKRIMKLIGLDLGKNRTPFQNMTDAEETAMKAELEAIHFFDRCNKF